MPSIAERVVARFAARRRWKYRWVKDTREMHGALKAEGKHTQGLITKGVLGWSIEVVTSFPVRKHPRQLASDGTIYKPDAKEMAEEQMVKWDREIDRMGREKWADHW